MRDGLARVLPAALLLSGCSGSGVGLDENGRPLDEPAAPLVAEFASIQDNVFTPICTGCHTGAAAPLGLRLDEGAAYAALVNAPSVEVPALRRVAPGNAAGSYLLQKIQGTASVGGRMPLGGTPLPQATIDTIRQWIVDGAQPPVALETLSSEPTVLTAVFPIDDAQIELAPTALVIAASAELDVSTLTTAAIALLRSGGDGSFAEGNEIVCEDLRIEVRSLFPTVIAVAPRAGVWLADRYELVISGGGPSPVLDRAASIIDGDANGIAGGDFVIHFELQVAP